MISSMELLTYLLGVVAVCCTAFYLFLRKRYKYWEELGVPGPKPQLIFGNMWRVFILEMTEAELMSTFYNEFPKERFIGIYNLWKPALLVRDLELVKNICVKDFNYFTDHPQVSSDHGTDQITAGLFFLKGGKWRSRRLILSKTVTPRRLKEYSHDLKPRLDGLLQDIQSQHEQDVNVVRFFDKTIATFLFASLHGLDLRGKDVMADKILELEEEFFHPPAMSFIFSLLYSVWPTLSEVLRLRTFSSGIWEFYSGLTKELLASRKGEDKRDDLITLLNKHMGDGVPETEKMDLKELVAHVHAWYLASHHTTTMTLCHTLLKLSLHTDVLEKVMEEMDREITTKLPNYEDIGKLVYLESVINGKAVRNMKFYEETLRQEPLLGVLKRTCTEKYRLDERCTVHVGMDVYIPAASLQMETDHFPEPQHFLPDRFLEKKTNEAFMPFGKGPRLCIGSRFAYMMLKLILATILMNFRVEASNKMPLPMVYDPKSVLISNSPLGGIWVKFKPRNPGA